MPGFSKEALRVLDVLRNETVDGYTLMRRTGLSDQALVDALKEIPATLVAVKGELMPERIGRAFMALDPNARAFAEVVVRDKIPR
jgi:hypothetical protein